MFWRKQKVPKMQNAGLKSRLEAIGQKIEQAEAAMKTKEALSDVHGQTRRPCVSATAFCLIACARMQRRKWRRATMSQADRAARLMPNWHGSIVGLSCRRNSSLRLIRPPWVREKAALRVARTRLCTERQCR